jgi:multiple antibiotic resistance protein
LSLDFLRSEWTYLTGAFVTILFIVDPFALVPVYLTLAHRFASADQSAIRGKAALIAFSILAVFAVSGMRFFQLFGITLPAFQIAGGLLLLMMGLSQLNSSRRKVSNEEEDEGLEKDDISVFPLATPLLAGPGAISTVILYSTEARSVLRLSELLVAVAAVCVVCYLVMLASPALLRLLGRTGLGLVSRLMGMVLTAVAVQFILNGAGDALATFLKR